MKKRLNFFVSIILIVVFAFGCFGIDAFSYATDTQTSSKKMLLVNTDTNTIVYSKDPSKKWYVGDLSKVMTFVIVCQNIKKPSETVVKLKSSFVNNIPYTDKTLQKFGDGALSVEDLLKIMMLTRGNDAAYVLAFYTCSGNVSKFVELMNKKAKELGMNNTNFVSPGRDAYGEALTTCTDMYRLYKHAITIDLFNDISSLNSFNPSGYDGDSFKFKTNNSLINSSSPYYFKYVTSSAYSNDTKAGASICAATEYHNSKYIFIALNGINESEENVFVDARRLATWAYLNLSDRKVINNKSVQATVELDSGWNDDEVELIINTSAYRTLPNEYDEMNLNIKYDIPETVKRPVFEGQNIGTAQVFYDGYLLDKANLVARQSKGVSLLSDISDFATSAYNNLFPVVREEEEPTEEEE